MQQTSELRRPRPSRARVAGYLALAALGSDALLIILSSGSGPNIGLLLALLSAGAWVLAVLLLSPIRDASPADRAGPNVRRFASISALAHVIAFLLPAAFGSVALDGPVEAIPGYTAYAVGFVVVPLAWLANPVYIVAFALHRGGAFRRAATLAAVAELLAVSAVLTVPNLTLGPGFLLWAASPALLAVAATLAQRGVEVPVTAAPSDT